MNTFHVPPVLGELLVKSVLALLAALLVNTAPLRAQDNPVKAIVARAAPQVVIEAKFMEFTPPVAETEKGLAALKTAPGASDEPRTITPDEVSEIVSTLQNRRGSDLLSTPRVTTRSGQRAMIEIVREVRYATEWKKEDTGWKETAFATRETGITFEVLARLLPDGVLQLQLKPEVVELLGYTDLDSQENVRVDEETAGRRLQPRFETRNTSVVVLANSGESVVLPNLPAGKGARKGPKRQCAILVTATLVDGAAVGAAGGFVVQKAPESPLPPEARHVIPLHPTAKLPFPAGDSVELLELRGSEPGLKTGGVYWLRGRYELGSRDAAFLYAGNTSEVEKAIEPVGGGVQSATIGKGRGEFTFAFKLLTPGQLHVTLYDPADGNPVNNAYAGWYLGEVK